MKQIQKSKQTRFYRPMSDHRINSVSLLYTVGREPVLPVLWRPLPCYTASSGCLSSILLKGSHPPDVYDHHPVGLTTWAGIPKYHCWVFLAPREKVLTLTSNQENANQKHDVTTLHTAGWWKQKLLVVATGRLKTGDWNTAANICI